MILKLNNYFCTLWSILLVSFIYLLVSLCFVLCEDYHQTVYRQIWAESQVQSCSLKVQKLTALPQCRSCHPYTSHSLVPRAHFSLTGTAAHGIPLHTLAIRERGHIGIGVHTLLHVAAPHAFGAATGALSTRRPQGTRCPALLGAVVRWEVNTRGTLRAPLCWLKSKSFQYGLWPISLSWNQFSGLY